MKRPRHPASQHYSPFCANAASPPIPSPHTYGRQPNDNCDAKHVREDTGTAESDYSHVDVNNGINGNVKNTSNDSGDVEENGADECRVEDNVDECNDVGRNEGSENVDDSNASDDDNDSEDSEDSDGSSNSDSSSCDDEDDGNKNEDDEGIFAFESILRAELVSGNTIQGAVRTIFDTSTEPHSSSARHVRLSQPILDALKSDSSLASDLTFVARMCHAIYSVSNQTPHQANIHQRLPSISSLHDVVSAIDRSSSIVVLTGAGISVSCGIPDFRSKGGLYDTVRLKYNLPEPEIIFDIHEFHHDPSVFYSFAKHVMPPPSLKPSRTHYFISQLAARNKLLRNYSQNIDGLESRAGVPEDRLVLCHGSFLTASCSLPESKCHATVAGSEIVDVVFAGNVPQCTKCTERELSKQAKRRMTSRTYNQMICDDDDDNDDDDDTPDIGVMKPDIVFFGEKVSTDVGESMKRDVMDADLVLVIGTSLKVEPVSTIPHHFPETVPRILVNRQMVGSDFDVELLGDCDTIVQHLCAALGWDMGEMGGPIDIGDEEKGVGEIGSRGTVRTVANGTGSGSKSVCMARDEGLKSVTGYQRSNKVQFIPPRRFIFDGALERPLEASEE